jgi:hypothetical protein
MNVWLAPGVAYAIGLEWNGALEVPTSPEKDEGQPAGGRVVERVKRRGSGPQRTWPVDLIESGARFAIDLDLVGDDTAGSAGGSERGVRTSKP